MATNTIDTGGGGDYTSWQAWEDDLPATLTEAEVGEQIDEEITGAVLTIAGHTTTSTFTITMTAEAGASFVDNADIETNALEYNAANGAAMTHTGGYAALVQPLDDDIFITRMQFKTTIGTSQVITNGGGTLAEIVTVDQCIMDYARSDGFVPNGENFTVKNSLAVQRLGGASIIVQSFGGPEFYNCTLVCPDALTPATNAVASNYGAGIVQNCLIFGATNVFTGSTTWTSTTSLTDDATPPTGFTTQAYADQFEDSDNDFRLKSGADAIDAGTLDSLHGAVSINGVDRIEATHAPDVLELSTNHSAGTITDIDEDPDQPDANYMTWDTNGNTVTEVSFPSPAVDLTAGADLQEFRVWLREDPGSGGSNTPAWDLSLYEFEGGTSNLVSSLNTGSDPLTGTLIAGTFNASSLTTTSGANVRLRVTQTSGGTGGPSSRRGIEVGACEWNTATENTDIGCWEFVAPAGGGMAWPSPAKQMAHLLLR